MAFSPKTRQSGAAPIILGAALSFARMLPASRARQMLIASGLKASWS
jgi:hypothetical protein